MSEARELKEEATRALTSAGDERKQAQEEKYAAQKLIDDKQKELETIKNEQEIWENTKKKHYEKLEELKNKQNSAYQERVKKSVDAAIIRYKSIFFVFTIYGLVLTVYLFIQNGGIADIAGILSWYIKNLNSQPVLAVLPTIIPIILGVIGVLMMKRKEIPFFSMKTLYFTLFLLMVIAIGSGYLRKITTGWNFIVIFFYFEAIRTVMVGLTSSEKSSNYY